MVERCRDSEKQGKMGDELRSEIQLLPLLNFFTSQKEANYFNLALKVISYYHSLIFVFGVSFF